MSRKLLFVHNNFPAQFGFIAQAVARAGGECRAIASPAAPGLAEVAMKKWKVARPPTSGILASALRSEINLLRGHAAAERAQELRREGFEPEVIVGHPGWGETVFLSQVFPRARQILYGEFYYHAEGVDVGFDPEFPPPSDEDKLRVYAKNATMALALTDAERIVAPTRFQASLHPAVFQPRMRIIHEGVDTSLVRPNPATRLTLAGGRVLDRSTPVITFINRRFEPLRGYHIFMRALPKVLASVPDAHALLIGADAPASYGAPAPKGKSWKQIFLDEVRDRLDMSRVHFTGTLPYAHMLAALSVSRAHVYYTYPFVLSWSLLEAMASECLVIGSDTAPMRDAVENGVNGLLLDFFDVDALAETLIRACREPARFAALRRAARATVVERFERKRQGEPAWLALIEEAAAAQITTTLAPTPTRS